MRYIISITLFCEPDNNTPASKTFIKIVQADGKADALTQAQDLERDFTKNNEEVIDSRVGVWDYQEDMLLAVGETWA